jgi:hypothetical protein
LKNICNSFSFIRIKSDTFLFLHIYLSVYLFIIQYDCGEIKSPQPFEKQLTK